MAHGCFRQVRGQVLRNVEDAWLAHVWVFRETERQDRYFYPENQAKPRVSALNKRDFMVLLHSLDDLRRWQEEQGWSSRSTGFVPTMGALHPGHASLIRRAAQSSDLVVVSVLVNPTQFNAADDFERYPRTLELDCEKALKAGADAVFAPSAEELYGGTPKAPPVHWGALTDGYEGAFRPGHFDGVVAVVDLLFAAVNPSLAVFGEKDLQQVAVVKRLARERHPTIEVVVAPLVREESGLAMSSRNARLGTEGLERALVLSRGLKQLVTRYRAGEALNLVLTEVAALLHQEEGVAVEYMDVVNAQSFERSVEDVTTDSYAVVAAEVNGVRLIDNMPLMG